MSKTKTLPRDLFMFSNASVVPMRSDHGGLTQKSVMNYTVVDGKRVPLPDTVDPSERVFQRSISMNLPLGFNPDTWRRHGYSFNDVVDTLDSFSSMHLWQFVLLCGLAPQSSSIKAAFQKPTSLTYSSKKIALTRITNFIGMSFKFPDQSVLDQIHTDHVPPPPIHRIPTQLYYKWKKLTPLPLTRKFLIPNYVNDVFEWNGIMMIPWEMQGDNIYMIRLVQKSEFVRSGRRDDSYSTRCPKFIYKDKTYYGIYDEVAFFLPSIE